MNTISNRINNRLPQFYNTWDTESVISHLINGFAYALEEQKKELYNIMRYHWIDTSYGKNLDLIGGIFKLKRRTSEKDDSFRERIKLFLVQFIGGGTKKSIISQTISFLGITDSNEIPLLIENPPTEKKLDISVTNGDEWTIKSQSVKDEQFSIELSVEEGGFEIQNPSIIDFNNNKEMKYNGTIKSGQKLYVDDDGKALLDKKDVSKNVVNNIRIPRKRTIFKFKEYTSPKIGKFDEANYDEHFFYIQVPKAFLTFTWTANLLSSFELQVMSKSLERFNLVPSDIENMISSVKAAGIKSYVKVISQHDNKNTEEVKENI